MRQHLWYLAIERGHGGPGKTEGLVPKKDKWGGGKTQTQAKKKESQKGSSKVGDEYKKKQTIKPTEGNTGGKKRFKGGGKGGRRKNRRVEANSSWTKNLGLGSRIQKPEKERDLRVRARVGGEKGGRGDRGTGETDLNKDKVGRDPVGCDFE